VKGKKIHRREALSTVKRQIKGQTFQKKEWEQRRAKTHGKTLTSKKGWGKNEKTRPKRKAKRKVGKKKAWRNKGHYAKTREKNRDFGEEKKTRNTYMGGNAYHANHK